LNEISTVTFKRRPVGRPVADDFEVIHGALPEPVDGEVLVASRYVSIDPYVRTMVDPANPYGEPLALGATIPGDIAGEVISSRNGDWPVGRFVIGRLGWRSHALTNGDNLRAIDPDLGPLPLHLGVFSSSGLTGYFGMLEIGRPAAGDTVLVSGAAGAVGTIASQLARIRGARVIGIAGGPAKCAFLTDECGLHGAIDYRATDDLDAALDKHCPDGINVYFDNVGGPMTHEVMGHLARHARIVVCGESSQYDAVGNEFNPGILGPLMNSRASMTGLLVSDFADRYNEARAELARLVESGELKHRQDIVKGLENAPAAFMGMLAGDNIGKRMVEV
jgi:NADPH:quinone reductase